jgi:uncharacterized protein (DUF1778 family)
MPALKSKRQLPRPRYFVNLPVYEEDLMLLDRASAIKGEPRATYVRRTVLREARADIREAERKAAASSAA